MDKPIREPQVIAINYHDAVKWIEKKLGKELRNYAGKTWKADDTKPYWDFWHYLMDCNEIQNPCKITIDSDDLTRFGAWVQETWIDEIVNAFIEEFGDDQDYWVSW